MKRADRIKLNFTRNWNFPGKERLSHWFKPSRQLKTNLSKGIIWLNTDDIAIYTNADNYIEWTILSTGTYEDEIGKLIKISLNTGDIALDIGANIGLQSLRMSLSSGLNGKVYAFEPLEYLQEKFMKNLELNKAVNVRLFPFALSDKESETDFKINKNSWNQGTFSLSNNSGTDLQRIIVKVADEIPEIQSLEKLALIKIDVEGFEHQVLKGLKQTLQKHKPRIIFEYDSDYWTNSGQNILDCFNFLTSLNYMVYQINSVGCELINTAESIQSGNLFCIQNPK
jgi:FkbM family methyltransferase